MTDTERLAEAKAALHQLLIGERVIRLVDQNGETIEFHRLSAAKLRAYIQELERAAGGPTGGPLQIYL